MFIQCPHCSTPEDNERLNPGDHFICSNCGSTFVAPRDPDESMGRIPEEFKKEDTTSSEASSSSDMPEFVGELDEPSDSSTISFPDEKEEAADPGSMSSRFTKKRLSSKDHEKWHRVNQAYRVIYVIAILCLLLGSLSSGLDVRFLQSMGIGVFAVSSGAVMGLLGYGVFRGSVACLFLAILLSITNAFLFLFPGANARYFGIRVSGCAIQLVLLYPMVRALPALMKLQQATWKINRLSSENASSNIHNASAGLFSLVVAAFVGLQISALSGPELFSDQFKPDEADITLKQNPPGTPEKTDQPFKLQFGTIRGKHYRWTTSDTVYTLGIYDLPQNMVKKHSEEKLVKNFSREYSSQIKKKLQEQSIHRKEYYGMNVIFIKDSSVLNGTCKSYTALYLKNSKLIFLNYLCQKNKYKAADAQSFIDSLELD